MVSKARKGAWGLPSGLPLHSLPWGSPIQGAPTHPQPLRAEEPELSSPIPPPLLEGSVGGGLFCLPGRAGGK